MIGYQSLHAGLLGDGPKLGRCGMRGEQVLTDSRIVLIYGGRPGVIDHLVNQHVRTLGESDDILRRTGVTGNHHGAFVSIETNGEGRENREVGYEDGALMASVVTVQAVLISIGHCRPLARQFYDPRHAGTDQPRCQLAFAANRAIACARSVSRNSFGQIIFTDSGLTAGLSDFATTGRPSYVLSVAGRWIRIE